MATHFRAKLLASTLLVGAGSLSPAYAQDTSSTPTAQPTVVADASTPSTGEEIVVTGSRIARPNLVSASPIEVVTGEDTIRHGDISLDTYLNTLPGVVASFTSTSNNPGNNGQSNIDLRGLGANRNLVLIDGRRAMVSASNQTVDLNTIPQQLIDRIDVVTGGAGAAYGADAIAGVVNVRLKNNFEGIDIRTNYANGVPKTDAREYQISGLIGGNFADGRGNIVFSAEYANREGLIKAQRSFASQATSTTGTPPVGRLVDNTNNAIPQAAIDGVFATYGVAANQAPVQGQSQIHFNTDGTLFGGGRFNDPLDVSNYRYDPTGADAAAANQNFYPDFYSYNFDAINLLVLPLKRKSAFMKAHYEISPAVEIFTQANYTEYDSATALAPTPIGVRIYNPATAHSTQYASSGLVAPGTFVTNSIIPVTNPFIPADLATLLAARTGDDPKLVGVGAAEPFRLAIRSLSTGLREQDVENRVYQGLVGLRGEFAPGWRYEAYYSYGKTVIDATNSGNVDVQKLQSLLEAPDGGNSICAGGYNPFGIQPVSADCVNYIQATGVTKTTFFQRIGQAYVTGKLASLPGGDLSIVGGIEQRRFRYEFDPGALAGPIAGFNTATPDLGTNSFLDYFGELDAPILKDSPLAQSLDLTLGYRRSRSKFNDIENGVKGQAQHSDAYKAELTWQPIKEVQFRGAYQHSVRAPNFGELFSGGSSFVQAFDPCSANTNFIKNGGANAAALCSGTGVSGVGTFVATPGLQVPLGLAGNTNLKPEIADTITGGVTFQYAGFNGSLDYYRIRIKKEIFSPETNLFIAACYGYVGNLNPTADPNNPYCQSVARSGSNLAQVGVGPALGGDANSNLILQNTGRTETSGLDFHLGYHLPTEFVGPDSGVNFDLYVNYLIDFKDRVLPGVTLNYAGTAAYFGENQFSLPRWKGNLDMNFAVNKNLSFLSRVRYIDKMKNRQTVQFPGEAASGPGTVWYFDFGGQVDVGAMTFRIGVNNAFDRKPPIYSPNVQSGTDPSLYDIIGRRAYVQAGLKF